MTKIILGHIDGETAKLLADKRGTDVQTLMVNLLHSEAAFEYFMSRELPSQEPRPKRVKASQNLQEAAP